MNHHWGLRGIYKYSCAPVLLFPYSFFSCLLLHSRLEQQTPVARLVIITKMASDPRAAALSREQLVAVVTFLLARQERALVAQAAEAAIEAVLSGAARSKLPHLPSSHLR